MVPGAMVIRAPIVYIKVVTVKKLVVGFWNGQVGLLQGELLTLLLFLAKGVCALY